MTKRGDRLRSGHIDASVDLPMDNPIAEVTAGDLIGELAALAALKQERLKRPKFYPRSAAASTRVAAPSLPRTFETWWPAVFSVMNSSSAMRRFV